MYKEADLVNKNNFSFVLESFMPCRFIANVTNSF